MYELDNFTEIGILNNLLDKALSLKFNEEPDYEWFMSQMANEILIKEGTSYLDWKMCWNAPFVSDAQNVFKSFQKYTYPA